MFDDVECSVLICTYQPKWDKLRLTLKSIVMQRDCKVKIVIADDGSENDLTSECRKFFKKNNFCNYEFTKNENNKGTVINILHGLSMCEGRYVKPLSPGDCLHNYHALRTWIDFMNNHKEYIMSYCDAIYYQNIDNMIIPLLRRAQPQSRKPTVKSYLLHRDLCLGASAMIRRCEWLKYLEVLRNKVIYAEDFSYQLMIYCGEKIINISREFLLYEYGTGVSTCQSQYWIEMLKKDEDEMDKILLSVKGCDEANKESVAKYLRIPNENDLKNKISRVIICPSKILFRIKWKIFPRFAPSEINEDYVFELLSDNN